VREHVTIEQRRSLLESEILAACAKCGNLIIPTFALDRTQELLIDIVILSQSGRIGGATVYVDSPLTSQQPHCSGNTRSA
jgi:metallo-beta-lactamase family protein